MIEDEFVEYMRKEIEKREGIIRIETVAMGDLVWGSPIYRIKEKHVELCKKEMGLLYSCLSKYVRIKDTAKEG